MIIKTISNATKKDKQDLIATLLSNNLKPISVITENDNLIVCSGKFEGDIRTIGNHKTVMDVFRVTDNYKLVSSQWKIKSTQVKINENISIGGKELTIIAGPCAIENEDQVESITDHLVENNIKIMRGGVFKPRSSPYSFRGTGIDGLKFFSKICRKKNIKIISEIMEISQLECMHDEVDILQIGARNSQNFNLLDAIGKAKKPVLLKRGISGSIDELLQSAEYIFMRGNDKIILCERGIRTFENAYRNTFDINAISILKEKSHLPVVADPSHGVGIRKHVLPIALAAIAAGVDGIIYETHPNPDISKSDAAQTINLKDSQKLIEKCRKLHEFLQGV